MWGIAANFVQNTAFVPPPPALQICRLKMRQYGHADSLQAQLEVQKPRMHECYRDNLACSRQGRLPLRQRLRPTCKTISAPAIRLFVRLLPISATGSGTWPAP